MTFEQFGIELLCVSQGLMWWRNARLQAHATAANAAAIELLKKQHGAVLGAVWETRSDVMSDTVKARVLLDDLAPRLLGALERKTRSDAGKPRKGRNGTASDEGLQPSDDPIGPVST